MRILVIGINIRHIAVSAARAGHEVIAADCFCDVDLEGSVKETILLPREGAKEMLPVYIERFHPEIVVLGPGMEGAQVDDIKVLNNPADRMALISDKLWQAHWLEKNGYPFIKTQTSPNSIRFPFIVKPRLGAGGVGCRIVKSANDFSMENGLIFQEHISGKPASVSVIGNGHEARAIAVNEQIIGASWAGAKDFRYCGNITPLETPHFNIAKMAEEIIAKLGLLGSNGVDFLLTRQGPIVVEVNARFQGSLDTVEMATGLNVFQAHLQSFAGKLPKRPLVRCSAGRAIIYASRDLLIKNDFCKDGIADAPKPGSRIRKEDPALSILARGSSRDEVMFMLMERAAQFRKIINEN